MAGPVRVLHFTHALWLEHDIIVQEQHEIAGHVLHSESALACEAAQTARHLPVAHVRGQGCRVAQTLSSECRFGVGTRIDDKQLARTTVLMTQRLEKPRHALGPAVRADNDGYSMLERSDARTTINRRFRVQLGDDIRIATYALGRGSGARGLRHVIHIRML